MVTSGFFDSLNGDRKYYASDFSKLFDAILADGIFAKVGDKFEIGPASGLAISVSSGMAWFNKVWVHNDQRMVLTLDPADTTLYRIDAIVIEIDTVNRIGDIKVITGTPASFGNVPRPSMKKGENGVYQYPLATAFIYPGQTQFTEQDFDEEYVAIKIGTSECPYAASISDALPLLGGYMRGPIDMDGHELIVPNPLNGGRNAAMPIGYMGLGGTPIVASDLDSKLDTGFWVFGDDTAHKPSHIPYGVVQCLRRNVTQAIQIAYDTEGWVARRRKVSDAWDEWEYDNPPLKAGVEYRTTERFLGKPVYVMLFDGGNLPNKDTKNVQTGLSSNPVDYAQAPRYVFDVQGFACTPDSQINIFPIVNHDHTDEIAVGDIIAFFRMRYTGVIQIRTTADLSTTHAWFLCKYTKEPFIN